MKQWPRYPGCTPEQRRALWALDIRERRSEQRWRQHVLLCDPALLAETLASDGSCALNPEAPEPERPAG